VVNAQQDFSVSIGFSRRDQGQVPLVSSNTADRLELARKAEEIGCFGTFSAAVAENRAAIRNSLQANDANAAAVLARVESRIFDSFRRVRFTEAQRNQITQMAREELAIVRSVNLEYVPHREYRQSHMEGFSMTVGGTQPLGRVHVPYTHCGPSSDNFIQMAHDSIAKAIEDSAGFGTASATIRQFAQAESNRLERIERSQTLRIFEENEVLQQAPGH
jgi:hypothetical protein